MASDDLLYLEDIQEAIEIVLGYTQGVDEAQFKERQMLQDAVVRQLEIIGEATKQLTNETREENSQIPWRAIADTRDRLIHGYFAVDLDEIWLMVQQDLPELKEEIKRIISEA